MTTVYFDYQPLYVSASSQPSSPLSKTACAKISANVLPIPLKQSIRLFFCVTCAFGCKYI